MVEGVWGQASAGCRSPLFELERCCRCCLSVSHLLVGTGVRPPWHFIAPGPQVQVCLGHSHLLRRWPLKVGLPHLCQVPTVAVAPEWASSVEPRACPRACARLGWKPARPSVRLSAAKADLVCSHHLELGPCPAEFPPLPVLAEAFAPQKRLPPLLSRTKLGQRPGRKLSDNAVWLTISFPLQHNILERPSSVLCRLDIGPRVFHFKERGEVSLYSKCI